MSRARAVQYAVEMRSVVAVDCAGVPSRRDFWERYLDAARPAEGALFGRNLDAFWDAVEGDGPGSPGDRDLQFENSRALEVIEEGRFRKALEEIAAATTRIRIELC